MKMLASFFVFILLFTTGVSIMESQNKHDNGIVVEGAGQNSSVIMDDVKYVRLPNSYYVEAPMDESSQRPVATDWFSTLSRNRGLAYKYVTPENKYMYLQYLDFFVDGGYYIKEDASIPQISTENIISLRIEDHDDKCICTIKNPKQIDSFLKMYEKHRDEQCIDGTEYTTFDEMYSVIGAFSDGFLFYRLGDISPETLGAYS